MIEWSLKFLLKEVIEMKVFFVWAVGMDIEIGIPNFRANDIGDVVLGG